MSDEDYTFYERDDGGIDLGAALRMARSDRGLSLEQVEQETKIRKRYLKGLENDDYSVLPDAVYAQGFLKTYANYLGLNGQELADELKRRRRPRRERHTGTTDFRKSGFDEPLIHPGGLTGAERRSISTASMLSLVVFLLVVGLVVGALYYIGSSSTTSNGDQNLPSEREKKQSDKRQDGSGENAAEKDNVANAEAPKPGSAGAGTNEKNAPPDKLEVLVSVEEAESWLRITSDGVVVYEQVAQPGFSQKFEADREVSLETGNAGAVTVEVNGQDVGPLGADGEVLTKDWTLKSAS